MRTDPGLRQLGAELARYRRACRLSVDDVAVRLGRSRSWVEKLEAGHLGRLSIPDQVCIGLFFGIGHPGAVELRELIEDVAGESRTDNARRLEALLLFGVQHA